MYYLLLEYSLVETQRTIPTVPVPFSGYNPLIPTTLPVSVSDLGIHVTSCHRDGNKEFSTQFHVSTAM